MSTTLVDGSARWFCGGTGCRALKEDIKCCDGSRDGIEAEGWQTKAIHNPVARPHPSSRKVDDFPTSRTGTTSSGIGLQHSRRAQHRGRNLQKMVRSGALRRPHSAPNTRFRRTAGKWRGRSLQSPRRAAGTGGRTNVANPTPPSRRRLCRGSCAGRRHSPRRRGSLPSDRSDQSEGRRAHA